MCDYVCMICGHEFARDIFDNEPEECPGCGSTDFITTEEYIENERINKRDDELQERNINA